MPEKILVIDDDPMIAAALTTRLEASGYDVTLAERGEAGLEEARRRRPDVIVLDVRLPDIDGVEVCTRLKGDPELASIPVIFLSANAVAAVREQALEAGGATFIGKPYDANALLAEIRRHVAAA